MVSASFLISSEKVAENSRFCRCCGSMLRMRVTSGMKPMSSMVSVETRACTELKLTDLFSDVVEQAAGGGDEDLDAPLQFGDLRFDIDAPKAHMARIGVCWLWDLTDSKTCMASSRVGARIGARTGCLAGDGLLLAKGRMRCRMGSVNAAVLPGAGLGAAHDVPAA